MIRRLVLFQPMTDDEARAATAWAEKLGDETLMLSYQPSPVPMRLLLFDAISKPGKKRRLALNMIRDAEDSAGQPARVMRAAAATRQVIFNVYVGKDEPDRPESNMSDLLFTVGLPDGRACGFLSRQSRFITDASKASHCMWRSVGHRANLPPDGDVRALFWPKKKPPDRRACEMRVIAYVEALLDTVAWF